MIKILRRGRRVTSLLLISVITAEILTPSAAHALTGGPSQPEVQGFQPAGTTEMVDLFSGDFSYNIPLFELPGPNGGYPFNLSYQSGVGMDQEASWVGLGWSLNPGAINRQMRGLPDEFKGDRIYTKMSMAHNVTVGLGVGASLEVFGADTGGSLSVGLSVSHNNFKGIGYCIDGSIGYSAAVGGQAQAGVNLGMSLDSKEGVGVNPSLSLTMKEKYGLNMGVGYNSKAGLSNVSMSLSYTREAHQAYKIENNKLRTHSYESTGLSSSASLSLAHPGYTPQITMPMSSTNIAATFKAGGAWWGVFASPYVTGFYNEEWVKHDKKRIPAPAYGYLHYQDATASDAMLDVNHEKEGIVSKETPNLAVPSLSYDIYSVTGQGISAMYRPMRNDYGIVRDPQTFSSSTGGSIGVDVGPAAHVGVNLSVNHARSTSGAWSDNNSLSSRFAFQKDTINREYEQWYFKVHGEPSVENASVINDLGGDKAVRVQLTNDKSNPRATEKLVNKSGFDKDAPYSASSNQERKSRNQVIQPITNEQLLNGEEEMISLFKVRYRDEAGNDQPFKRDMPGHHTAGFTALSADGLRYVYGIPAYNLLQEEVTFTARRSSDDKLRADVGKDADKGDPVFEHSETEKYLRRVEMPKFAHSYLLTAIVGPDYVDILGDGVTTDDLGYWVKFTYQKTTTGSDPYRWRDPFYQAHFQEGWKTDPRDDKGSFVYGEKDIWFLAQAETKSHIATFSTEDREDGRGVARRLQTTNATGKATRLLRNVKLYTRSAGGTHPIKTVQFDYDYSLCQGVDNSATGKGKLTLKKVWFEYGNSQRSKLNPYVFTYHSNNPDYDNHSYDRWGNYKPHPAGDYLHNHDFPYVDQDPLKKQEIDNNAAAWSLKEIQMPSGGKVIVDYESDDYGYVQHKPAMQMLELVPPEVPADQAASFTKYDLSDATKIRFRLETPIDGNVAVDQKAEVLKYLDQQRKQLYFKIKVNLRSSGENFHEYISGYADINLKGDMGLEQDAAGKYAYGYFHVHQEDGHHPFSMRTWQHLRTNQPELANSGRKLKQTESNSERVKQIKGLGSVVAQVRQMFGGFYRFCKGQGWGREVIVGKSWIRVNSPDKIKYGGGLRVRQITVKDQWPENNPHVGKNEEGIYGQLYEYTIEENKKIISSGVAAYEPLTGGDENPLRYAKKYTQSVPLRTSNNLFFEYPINETYYPGPQVGYRKVSVTSLAAAHLAGKAVKNITLSDNKKLFPEGEGVSYGTTGMTVHEFYTAKDFPVITDETDKQDRPYKLPLMIPFLGSISISKLSSSQGYSIITNDMHGKPMKVSNYRQDKSGKIESEPMSWVKYNYASEQKYYEQEKISVLHNLFKKNDDGTLSLLTAAERNSSIEKFTLGQENEFFADMREYEDKAWNGGVRLNTDIVWIIFGAIVIPVPWPSIGKSQSSLRTAVTNKVIFKSGILESTEAFDGGSLVKTQPIKWDALTGSTILTVVNNNFDAPMYSYTIPAHTQYEGMGAAYQNAGLKFSIRSVKKDPYESTLYEFVTDGPQEALVPGDEILLYNRTGKLAAPLARVVYTGEEDDRHILYSETALAATEYKCMIIRSGFRNQLSVQAGSITALEDPSRKGAQKIIPATIRIPQ
jgi:hypothetical protein